MMQTLIPFSGFYSSLHSDNVDQTVTQLFADRDTGCNPNEGLEMALSRTCNYKQVYANYAKAYCENFGAWLGIPSLKFEELSSPREYNFTTDRIFAKVSLKDLYKVKREVLPTALAERAKSMLTSYDGFMSYYSPDVKSWGGLANWDANQCNCLLAAYADEVTGGDFDQWAEHGLMDGLSGNGFFDRWIEAATFNIQRLYKIHDYLETRAHRASVTA
jgi:hypothetical protein